MRPTRAMCHAASHRVYRAARAPNGRLTVIVDDGPDGRRRPLRLRLDLHRHSPTGFECGYAGSGPAQLALAILADALGEDDTAHRLHQKYKFEVIAKLPRDADWEISRDAVINFVGECV